MAEKKLSKTITTPYIGRDEMNLAEFPFAKLNSRDRRDVITYEGAIVVDGQRLSQTWIVRGAGGLGLPSEFGERLLIALMAISAEDNFASRTVNFSINDLIKRLGIAKNARHYRLIEDQLDRLVGVTIQSENAFWDHEGQERVTTRSAFHIIESLWLRYRDGKSTKLPVEDQVNAYIIWGEDLYRSFQAGYIKRLDLQFFYNLPTPLSRRLYRFLDKRMAYQDTYEIDIFDLANRMGCVRYEVPAQVIRLLKPAQEALVAQGFLESATVIKHGKYRRFRFKKASQVTEAVVVSDTTATSNTALDHMDPSDDDPRPNEPADQAAQWQSVLDRLRLRLTKSTFDTWLQRTTIVRLDEQTLVVGVHNQYAKDWIENRLKHIIEIAIKECWADVQEIVFEVVPPEEDGLVHKKML